MIATLEKPFASYANGLLLIGRLLLALIFLHEALSLSTGFAAAAAAMSKLGVSSPVLALTIALQLGAGTMLALGWHARLGAFALALFCLATAFMFHTHVARSPGWNFGSIIVVPVASLRVRKRKGPGPSGPNPANCAARVAAGGGVARPIGGPPPQAAPRRSAEDLPVRRSRVAS
jgi:putative oxidoreductase